MHFDRFMYVCVKPIVMLRSLLLCLLFLPFERVFAQELIPENPNLDQVPLELIKTLPAKTPTSVASVITIGDYDNFNLGVDLAENNMAADPAHPSWFFTAYNLNGTHHTENGFQWFSNNPDFGTGVRGDPVVAYDSLGNLYYINMIGSPNVTGCRIVKSTDNGTSWTSPVDAITGYDKCWLACDQTTGPYANYVYVTMSSGDGGNFARSMNHGTTFHSTFQPPSQSLPGMMACVGPYNNIQGGAVYVVTNSGSSFASTYTFYQSLDGGETFSIKSMQDFSGYVGTDVGGRNSVENMRTRPYPFIAADNSYGEFRGRLYLVYASNDPPGNGNKPDIFCRYSDDGGGNWSAAVKVNDDPNTLLHHQWHPAIWCDKETGKLYVQWMDTRDTPSSDSAFIYASYSDNGGQGFTANQKISNQKMKINCSSCGGGGTPRYQGDYNGIVSNKKVAMAGWTDFREGTFMSTTAYFPDFAMKLDHSADTLDLKKDTVHFFVIIPGVKLYADLVYVSAGISPEPANGSITFFYPQGNTASTFPDTIPVDIILNGSALTGDYLASFYARGPNGTPVHFREAAIHVRHGSGYYVYPTATPDTICTGASSQLSAYVNGGTPPYTYAWLPVAGLSDPSIANPVASLTESRRYYVTATDAMMNTDHDSVEVSVKLPPTTPGPISGEQEICMYAISVYSVNQGVDVTSYSWTVPDGANILSGQNTPKIRVRWGNAPGNVSVIVGNECGTSNPSVLSVLIKSVPEIPGNISGPDFACSNGSVDFSVTETPGALTYQWVPPPGAIINSGQGTSAINITWGAQPDSLRVYPENECGPGKTLGKFVGLDSLPAPAMAISGRDTVCQNHENYLYHIPLVSYATDYVWTLPPGAEITFGKGTNEVTLFFHQDAASGNISAAGKNQCGNGPASEKFITVSPCAGYPETDVLPGFTLFPNPAREQVNMIFDYPAEVNEIIISDMKGRLLLHESIPCGPQPCSKQIDVSAFPKGLVVIKLISRNSVSYKKLVVL